MNWISLLIFCTLMNALTAQANSETEAVFDEFWEESQKIVYDRERETKFWTKDNYKKLKAEAAKAKGIYELQKIINGFLGKLDISHTRFYTNRDLDFYFFRSLFTTRDIMAPKVRHIGVQLEKSVNGYIVREVLDGYPAHKNGIRRGDQIVSCKGRDFSPVFCFENVKGDVPLKIRRAGKTFTINLAPVYESLHESFLKAMSNSLKITNIDGKKIGYLRLWAGTNNAILKKYQELIRFKMLNVDGIILDLRGGFGGAWYDYLDPYFKNRKDFFVSTRIDRDGKKIVNKPEPKKLDWYFNGPMVVLINEGVRSGKESLAFQFKKSKRATLVGEKTEGAFTAGYAIFKDLKLDYFLYLASAEILLDGSKIEGVGVSPDIKVSYPLLDPPEKDPQLNKSYEILLQKLKSKTR